MNNIELWFAMDMLILPRNEDHPARRRYCRFNMPMPDFYMADFSLLGLMVDDYERTLQLFNDKRLPLKWTDAGAAYPFNHSDQLRDLVQMLRSSGIDCGLSDIADQIYQG